MNKLYSFFFNDTATTEIYTLSLHDALPISAHNEKLLAGHQRQFRVLAETLEQKGIRTENLIEKLTAFQIAIPSWALGTDRKSTRLNSSHANISYAVFCLKKKKYQPISSILL